MNKVFTPEQICLANSARTFWDKRGQAKKYCLPFGEETVTETFLLDLASTYPGSLTIVPFNKQQEAKTGSDWAWCFESADGKYLYPMMVQAKVLDAQDKEYGHLDHKIGKTNCSQIDQLIKVAENLRFPAYYVFYNHLNDVSRVPDKCPSFKMQNCGPQPETWGISIADASNVKAALPDKTFDTHTAHSLPLHCLFCSHGTGEKGVFGTPGLIAERINGVSGARSRSIPEGVRSIPIPLFKKARKVNEIENPEDRQSFIDRLSEEFPGIDGVVIMRDANSD